MAIEIRIVSSWETEDSEGRRIEVSVSERAEAWEDPIEDTTWFAGGDLERLKRHLSELIDRKAHRFLGRHLRECAECGRVQPAEDRDGEFLCASCRGIG